MKVNHVLLISLLIVGALFVPAVSAGEIIIDDEINEFTDTSAKGYTLGEPTWYMTTSSYNHLRFTNIENYESLCYIIINIPSNVDSSYVNVPLGRTEFTYNFNGADRPGVIYREHNTDWLGNIVSTKYTIFLNEWDIGDLQGTQSIRLPYTLYRAKGYSGAISTFPIRMATDSVQYVYGGYPLTNISYTIASYTTWKNRLLVETSEEGDGYNIHLYRKHGIKSFYSTLMTQTGGITEYTNYGDDDITLWVPQITIDQIKIISFKGDEYVYPLSTTQPTTPPTPGQPVYRTGTVTMTDNNGTTITGFEVTAVNHYTGQSYNVSTDTDVAVMTLPMDRTVEIRNPQTGVYEEAPVGYYKFYGHKTGYKMLNEDGIKVSVLPEKYTSYQLCIIGVTSESGYLTGKHKFQIRSRSDNSILQTGTVSAKSATTGEWYNTTVSDGIATLILAYDTSNPISQYAGNYYVYATSPGYQENDYGTQIVVMPHRVSEINNILLTPIGGIPAAGNVTLRIQAFSETGPGVVNAEIFIAGVVGEGSSVWDTYTASSTGYLTVSVPGNSTYDIVASAEGYYDSARRIEVFTDDPPLIEIKLYLSGPPTLEPTTPPTGWPTDQPTTQPTGGIPDDDDGSGGFLMQAVRGIGLAFGVGFATAKLIFGMLLALSIGYATAKQLRGGAAEFGLGLLGGTLLGVLIGLLPVWTVVVLLLIVGLYIGNRYIGGANNG